MSHVGFEVQGTWDGHPLASGEFARIAIHVDADHLIVQVEAADYGDSAPPGPPGACMMLWEYEVVELFLLGAEDRYLEIELGPHGHHLGLCLAGRRQVVESAIPIDYRVEPTDAGWKGEARLSLTWLPKGVRAGNAYAIHGEGQARRYLAAQPVPGPAPDFHRLECFAPITLE